MNESETPQRREEKAVQALISAALHATPNEVTAQEIQAYLEKDVELSAADEAALGCHRSGAIQLTGPPPSASTPETEALMALHRKQPTQGFSAQTEEEIRRKREALLEKLRKKKDRA